MTPFELALSRIDAANADDPNTIVSEGQARPAELVYSERMSAMLARVKPDACEALQLAARAQHLRRWTIPRDSYPMDRAGYHRWRGDLKCRHAEWASAILSESGLEPVIRDRVASLIRKENLKTDCDAQTLEDVACLVFLQFYAAEFAAKHELSKMIGILQKTWKKMSVKGHKTALDLPLDGSVRSLVREALTETVDPVHPTVPLNDVAVILAAHGDRGGERPNATLLGHCAALLKGGGFHSVDVGLLRGEPSLEDAVQAALAAGAPCLAIYPMFMAEGYFTSKVLMQRLAALDIPADVHVLPPFGADPRLPRLMLTQAIATADQHKLRPETSRLLVVGHGSKFGPASADATRAVADAVAGQGRFGRVETAFLEEAEFLVDALSRDVLMPTVILGFFSGDGLHAAEDVPEAITATKARAFYSGSIGTSPAVVEIVQTAIAAKFSG